MNTNEERNWTVYIHINKINNKKYVGITKQTPEKRWRNGNHYKGSPYFYSAIQKYGWDGFKHIVLYTGFTEADAKWKERFLIKLLHTWIYDPLKMGYNITTGGDGTPGCKSSIEKIEKIRRKLIGRKLSDEHKATLKKVMTGRNFSDEWKNKISESHIGGKNPVARKIVHIDSNYRLIKEYDCARDAERELGFSTSNILRVCHRLAKHTHENFFMFYEDYIKSKEELINQTIIITPYRRKVRQLTLNKEFVAEYDSRDAASKATGIDASSIGNVCMGKRQKTAGGFLWEYIN